MKFFFANQILDTDTRELSREDMPVSLEPQVFDLVVHLMENRDRVVSKDELIEKIWKGRHVAESTLTSRINAARKAVGDSGSAQAMIRTVARKGFRFVGAVQTGGEAVAPAAAGALRHDDASQPIVPLGDRPGIAVLPFINMSGDRDQDYFSDGISEDIITALSKLRWFFVIARNSSFTYKGRCVHLNEMARELGVRYVVEGSVRRSGERVRISAQLNDVSTGSHLWAERYDRDLADVFAVQDEITEAIVAAVEPHLYAAESFRAQRKPPDSMDAWDLVMRALSHYWRLTREDCLVAQALLEKAISIDPNYSQALGLLATSHTISALMGWEDNVTAARIAEGAAQAAIRADSGDPWAHYALACVYMYAGRLDDSRAEFEWALRLNPNFSLALCYCGLLYFYCGRAEEAELATARALRLNPRDPLSAVYFGAAACAQFTKCNYKEAVRLAHEAVRRRPDFPTPHRILTAAAAMAGDDDLASAALAELRRVQPDISLEWIAKRVPFQHEAERRHHLEAFRRAGLR